ncbi:MAG: TetR/AcrR family transcriptional regulator [bacterium]|jgi:AcrR family transcriptional regulator
MGLPKTTPQAGTKDRILDAAEELFAERGFRETSLRHITSRARVNLAAVNYHFKSKDALIQAVLARRIGPINEARLAMLDRFEAEARGGPVPLEKVLRALIEPLVKDGKAVPPSFKRLFGRAYGEPGELFTEIVKHHFGPARERFAAALRRALPDEPAEELFWKVSFTIGAMAHLLTGNAERIRAIWAGLVGGLDMDAAAERLIAFAAAGFRAPALARPAEKVDEK